MPEGLVLLVVLDRDPVTGAVAHDRPDEMGEVAHRERDLREAVVAKLVDHDVEDRAVAHREQRLWEHGGVGPQPGALAAREYHCASSHPYAISAALDSA